MLRTLRSSAALLAAIAALTSPLAAQTATAPQDAPAAPAASAPAAPVAALPSALTELGISDARIQDGRRGGQRAEGTLPGGQAFRAMLDEQSQLRMIGVEGEGTLPADIVSRLVPEAVRGNAIFAEFAQLRGIGRGDEGVMLFGTDAQGQNIRAGFSADGTLQRFGRGDMDRDGERHGKRRGDGDQGHHRGDKGRDHPERDGDRGRPEGARDTGGPRPEGAAAPLDDAAIQNVLRDAGYTQPGTITRDGPRTEVEAVNPEGEPVTVTVNPRGVVVRELAR